MHHETAVPAAPETVPLQNAVLCVDCELVTSSKSDVCPVCGGHSLLILSTIIGGTLVDHRHLHLQRQHLFLFDLQITVEMSQLEGAELSEAIEGITRIVAPKLGRNKASVHISVEPVSSKPALQLTKAA